MRVVARDGSAAWPMQRLHHHGFFSLELEPGELAGAYDLECVTHDGRLLRQADPYAFGPLLGDQDVYYFREGTHQRLWECLGARLRVIGGVHGVQFAVWAPNAKRVSVVGDFNQWDGRVNPMRNREGVWEIFLPGITELTHYKFELLGADGGLHL